MLRQTMCEFTSTPLLIIFPFKLHSEKRQSQCTVWNHRCFLHHKVLCNQSSQLRGRLYHTYN